MPEKRKFDVRLDPDALREYNKLDNSVLDIVNKQIDELEFRADEVGKILKSNNSTKLAGCREIKLRDAGLRIIYRVTNKKVEVLRIVYILTIERRSKDFVFKIADKRNKEFRQLKDDKLSKYLKGTPAWKEKKNPAKRRKIKSQEEDNK
jgi:mRNA interferase RelE/StbE